MIDVTLRDDIGTAPTQLYEGQPSHRLEDTMSLTRRLAQHHRAAQGRRALQRAIASAPTEASRHELLVLLNR